jgi:hypothetical protein
MLLVQRFAFLTAGCGEDEEAHNRGAVARYLCGGSPSSRFRPACMTCGAWPPCHKMGTLVRIGGDFARDASGREWGNLPLKKGFIPRVAAMSCFSPTRGALSPSSSLRPFAFKVSTLCRHNLPWPCDFIPSAPRLSECSKWYIACLDGMSRYLLGGLVLVSLLSTTSPPKSLCSLFPNSPVGWLCRSHLSLCRCWRGLASGLYPWCPLRRRPHCPDAAQGVVQDVVRRGGGGRVLGWSCPHPRMRTGARTSSHALRWPPLPASHRCKGGRRWWRAIGAEVAASFGGPLGVEVVAAAGEAARS